MRRYQYRLNDQNVSLGPWGAVTPLKYIETVPGETYGGTFSVKLSSGLIDKVIHSRAYYDLYAFYCPIRLLWDQFPNHLGRERSDNKSFAPPVTKNLWPENFESTFVGNEGEDKDGVFQNSAFLRRMYYMVGFSFFHHEKKSRGTNSAEKQKEKILNGDYDDTRALIAASARPSTLESSIKMSSSDQQNIYVQNGMFQLDDVRRAYATDRFEKMRDFYGARYTDVLKGYGIKADWGILQEPECIGVSNNDLRFVQRNSTGDNNFGQRNGYFEGDYKLKIRKTFAPEHGIIMVAAVARADVFNTTSGSHIMCTRDFNANDQWYEPITFDAYNSQKVPGNLFDSGVSPSMRWQTPIGEHLRKGRNEIAVPEGTDLDKLPIFARSMTEFSANESEWMHAHCNPDTTEDVRSNSPSTAVMTPSAEEEAEPKIENQAAELVHYTEVRVAKRSPVKPAALTASR